MSSKDYEKNSLSNKFIYLDEIYYKFKEGISLYDTKYYASDKPIKLKKKDLTTKKKHSKEYFIRFFTLIQSPNERYN